MQRKQYRPVRGETFKLNRYTGQVGCINIFCSSKMKGVYTRRGRSETDAIRSLTSVGKHSSKESVPSRPVSRLCRQTAAFKLIESARDNYFYTKEFQEKVRKLLLKKQPYKAPVFG